MSKKQDTLRNLENIVDRIEIVDRYENHDMQIFMKQLAEIYDTFGIMSTKNFHDVLKEKAVEFEFLYKSNNMGENKSIETKRVYIELFQTVIDNKDVAYKQKAVSDFIKPLLNTWITNILLNLFKSNDVDKKIESQIQTLSVDVLNEYTNIQHYSIRLDYIRSLISPRYDALKKIARESRITVEQFETMFVKYIDPDQGCGSLTFCRDLMQGSMAFEKIEL